MYRIARDKVVVNWKPCTTEDTVVFSYGEVDCRANIGKQISKGRDEDEIINELTQGYMDTLINVGSHAKIIVVAVILPTTNEEYCKENPNGGFPFVSSDVDRVRFTKKVNEQLTELCHKNNILFLNPYLPYTRRELSDGNVHVGNSAHVLKQFMDLL